MFNSITYDEGLIEDLFNLNLFSSKSPALTLYYNDSDLWKFIQKSIKDNLLIKLMIFNQNFNIAPLHTYIQYYAEQLKEMCLSGFDKQCLGSVVTILFISLGYRITKRCYRGKSLIKYAAFFAKADHTEPI